jgi:hypothetical protein
MKRIIISIVATLITAFAAIAVTTNFSSSGANAVESQQLQWNGKRGADNLPCTGGTLLWIFTGHDATSATLYLDGQAYPGDQMGKHGSYHFTTPGTGVTTSSSAVVYYDGAKDKNAVVTISHCTDGGPSTGPPSTEPPMTS